MCSLSYLLRLDNKIMRHRPRSTYAVRARIKWVDTVFAVKIVYCCCQRPSRSNNVITDLHINNDMTKT